MKERARPTSGRFEGGVRARVERDEFLRGQVPEGELPVTPRPAATIVVARPAVTGFEVLLLQRPMTSSFAAGAYVFPGGAVDDEDASPIWENRLPPGGERAACAAALRELFEETGIIPGGWTNPGGHAADRLAEARGELLAETVLFSDLAERFGLDFTDVSVAYFSRWITPRTLGRRFDTRFFLLALGPEPVEVQLTREHDSALWERPSTALERFATGELPMLFPTRKTLEGLSRFSDLQQAFEAFREISVEPILAKLRVDGDDIRPLMPGDPYYDETY